MKPTLLMENKLLYSESTNLNVNFTKKKHTLTATSRLVFDHIPGHCGQAKLTLKMNHDKVYFFKHLHSQGITKYHHEHKIPMGQQGVLGSERTPKTERFCFVRLLAQGES